MLFLVAKNCNCLADRLYRFPIVSVQKLAGRFAGLHLLPTNHLAIAPVPMVNKVPGQSNHQGLERVEVIGHMRKPHQVKLINWLKNRLSRVNGVH